MAVRSLSSPSRSRTNLIPQDKGAVIIDIGHCYTRIGLSGEAAPRHIIKSCVTMKPYGEVLNVWDKKYINREELYLIMCRFLSKVYLQSLHVDVFSCNWLRRLHHLHAKFAFAPQYVQLVTADYDKLQKVTKDYSKFQQGYGRYLMINPRDYRVVIVESILAPSNFRNTLAKSLFVHFSVPHVCFLPHHLACLFTLGTLTALVIDIGYKETSVVPVYEGIPLINSIMVTTTATSYLYDSLQQMLVEHVKVQDTTNGDEVPISSVTKLFTQSVLTDILINACFVRPLCQNDKTPLDAYYLLDSHFKALIPGFLRYRTLDVLYHGTVDDISIPICVAEALLHCPIDCRLKLCENIIITGGSANLPGFNYRLKEELKVLFDEGNQYKCLNALELKFHSLISNPNYTAWQGASIIGAVEPAIMERSISKEDFKSKQYQLPEWMSCDSQQWECLNLSPRKHTVSPAQQRRFKPTLPSK